MRLLCLALSLLFATTSLAQVPVNTTIPDVVFLEDLTWDEIRDLLKSGSTNVIVATGGTEQNGPHMILGKHNYVLRYTTEKIARALGKTLVAPIIAYVPEGDTNPPSSHMRMAGTVSLPVEVFNELLEHTARSLKGGGFKNIILLGDSGGNQASMRTIAEKLNTEWNGTGVRVLYIPDYYQKSQDDQRKYLTENLKVTPEQIGSHAGMLDTSEVMAINPFWIRHDKIAVNGGSETSGVNGDPTKASVELGELFLKIKIDNAVAQIKQLMAQPGN